MRKILNCPLCSNTTLVDKLETTDYFLSQESFKLTLCEKCGILITNPQPEPSELPSYYASKNYLSHKKGISNLFDLAYKTIRKISINQKIQLLYKFQHDYSILDFGCGTGDFLFSCAKKGWKIYGFEPGEAPRIIAEEKTKHKIYSTGVELENMPKVSIITLWHVFEHIPNPNELLSTLKNQLLTGGKILFALPNHESFDASHYLKHWAAYDVPRHLYHYKPSSFTTLLLKNGLKVDAILPLKFDAFYISYLSEKYKTGKVNLIKSFINGYKSNVYGKKTGDYSSLIFVVSKC